MTQKHKYTDYQEINHSLLHRQDGAIVAQEGSNKVAQEIEVQPLAFGERVFIRFNDSKIIYNLKRSIWPLTKIAVAILAGFSVLFIIGYSFWIMLSYIGGLIANAWREFVASGFLTYVLIGAVVLFFISIVLFVRSQVKNSVRFTDWDNQSPSPETPKVVINHHYNIK